MLCPSSCSAVLRRSIQVGRPGRVRRSIGVGHAVRIGHAGDVGSSVRVGRPVHVGRAILGVMGAGAHEGFTNFPQSSGRDKARSCLRTIVREILEYQMVNSSQTTNLDRLASPRSPEALKFGWQYLPEAKISQARVLGLSPSEGFGLAVSSPSIVVGSQVYGKVGDVGVRLRTSGLPHFSQRQSLTGIVPVKRI